jgi:ribonuclease D
VRAEIGWATSPDRPSLDMLALAHALGDSVFTIVQGDLDSDLLAEFRRASIVAVDTETSGLSWATDRLELCQLHSPSVGTALVQPGPGVPKRLLALLADRSVTKLFHHAPFDLEFLYAQWGVRAASVRCTKIAAKILTPDALPAARSLGSLAKSLLGVEMDKGAVRTSDWGVRTLSDEQVAYACADVEVLPALYGALTSMLNAAGRMELYEASCDFAPYSAELKVLGYPDPFSY